MNRIGIIVGNGKLPLYFLREAEEKDIICYPLGVLPSVDEEIKKHKNYKEFNIGEIGEIVKYFLLNDIKEIVMLGKIEKELLFKDMKLDIYGEKIIEKLPDRKDETLLFAVIAFLRLNGIKVLPQNYLLKNFMFAARCYTSISPDERDRKTLKLGIEAAKRLSGLDAGQCVICKDQSVVALEGIEGTDETILRGGKLAGPGTIIVKMARPQQDMRVDIPAVGINTIKRAVEIGARGIAAEASKMLFLEQREAVELAEKHGIFIVGIKV